MAAGGGGGLVAEKPWILVFDMDDTITRGNNYNRPVYDVLAKAIRQRGNTVKYIFLLTNNDNTQGTINKVITRLIGTFDDPKPMIFNAIKYIKEKYEDNPAELVIEDILGIPATTKRYYDYTGVLKNLKDVADLMSIFGEDIDYTDIFKRYKVMFFDDLTTHTLTQELNAANDKSQYRYVRVYPKKNPQNFSEELALLGPESPDGAGGGATRKNQAGGASRRKSKNKAKKTAKKLTKKPRSK